ncbi:hypothetical protein JCM3770_005966 [Rhodotorula araucariae]
MESPLDEFEWPADLGEVRNNLERTQADLADCGPAVVALVVRIFALLRTPSRRSLAQATHLGAHLLRLADDKLNSYPYKDVPRSWRRLYTDAALLGALARLAAAAPTPDECKLAVHDCDMALVIAGAPGPQRDALALALIRHAQDALARASEPEGTQERPAKRARVASPPLQAASATVTATARPAPYLHRPLPERRSLPMFVSGPGAGVAAVCTPFVVRGALGDSDAVARWHSLGYLRSVAGPARVVPVEVGGDYTAAGWGQRMMDFGEFLDALERTGGESGRRGGGGGGGGGGGDGDDYKEGVEARERETLYLAQHALFTQFPALRADLPLPDLVYSAPEHDAQGAEYAPPGGDEGMVLNAWIGPGGTKSAAHTDPWWNCYVQVVGSKWIWVAPPDCAPAMAAFGAGQAAGTSQDRPPRSGAGGDAVTDGEEEEEWRAPPAGDDNDPGEATELMTNTSTLDVSVAPLRPPGLTAVDAAVSDDPSYPPTFLSSVAPRAFQAVLAPGDVLVLPPRWWHSLVALERSFSVSVWF